ncbi:MAG: peptidoglycan editing factor PgeF [Acidobacteriaceae bacterium]|nr:peptidoglycan editing factor PgeF [Acidobacteriaceae bacterium]
MNDSFRLGNDGIYRCDAFQQFVWQKHGFGTRAANPDDCVTLRQIHSNQVVNANGLKDREREGDALVTDLIGRSIAIRTADCVPILLLDSRTRAVASIHAGWRGTVGEIAKRTLERMEEDFESDPADVYAAIGPCIRACCYEVGSEVADQFEPDLSNTYSIKPGKRTVDLAGANRRQLLATGVGPEHIFDCGLCTTCLCEQFFSYRRQPEHPGRMLSAIARLG